mgnify:CR=1 FL=1
MLNHDRNRDLGGTDKNLELKEDNIGLRAIAEINDPEVIELAKKRKLRGWSFGFVEKRASEEEGPNGMKRRFVEELELKEVSIIDQRKMPCYIATSIEARAEDAEETVEIRELDTEGIVSKEDMVPDLSAYKNRIKNLGGNT